MVVSAVEFSTMDFNRDDDRLRALDSRTAAGQPKIGKRKPRRPA
jgi:hypothetical protein